jgi:hypothetical protein
MGTPWGHFPRFASMRTPVYMAAENRPAGAPSRGKGDVASGFSILGDGRVEAYQRRPAPRRPPTPTRRASEGAAAPAAAKGCPADPLAGASGWYGQDRIAGNLIPAVRLGERGNLVGCPVGTLGRPADGPIEGVAAI